MTKHTKKRVGIAGTTGSIYPLVPIFFGTLKNVNTETAGKALNNEIMFDSSSIEGFA